MPDSMVYESIGSIPAIHVVSDSVGLTAQAVARAAAAQFGVTNPAIEVLPKVRTFEEIQKYLEQHSEHYRKTYNDPRVLVLFTLVDQELASQLVHYVEKNPHIIAVDLMTNVVNAISQLTREKPTIQPGSMHVADHYYFRRIEAIEFSIAHDDGRNTHELTKADIVLLGVSRSSKTPTSIYLAQQGYKVANVPLDPAIKPPKELFNVEPTRLFGLMTTPEVLINIRRRRLGRANGVAARYADPEFVYQDLEESRALMRQLGCIVIHTENRAVEEVAQEILRYFERVHPTAPDMMYLTCDHRSETKCRDTSG